MESLASGDLSHAARARVDSQRVVVHSADELGAMAVSFNTMQDEVGRAASRSVARARTCAAPAEHLETPRRHRPAHRGVEPTALRGRGRREVSRTTSPPTRRAPAALLVIDLDNFKYVNDSHGHAVGDVVLQHVAALLTEQLRTTDVIARLGGDEFAVLLRNIPASSVLAIAGKLGDAIRGSRFSSRTAINLRLSVSIGITTFGTDDDLTPAELLVNADIAMYDAKEAGRDRVCVAAADVHQARAKNRQTWLQRIKKPSTRQFELHAQPILHLASGQVTQLRAAAADAQ